MYLYTTDGGYRRMLEKIRKAIDDYDRVIATNGDAADAGDTSVWHDNFAYEDNQRQMHKLAKRVTELKEIRAKLAVVPLPQEPNKVGVGTAVTIEAEEGLTVRHLIVGFEDGDPTRARLSYTAPLAKALLGAGTGETRIMKLNGREKEYVVIKIEKMTVEEDQ